MNRNIYTKEDDIHEKMLALSSLMKHQTGKDFVFNEKMSSSVAVIKVCVSNFTGKICNR